MLLNSFYRPSRKDVHLTVLIKRPIDIFKPLLKDGTLYLRTLNVYSEFLNHLYTHRGMANNSPCYFNSIFDPLRFRVIGYMFGICSQRRKSINGRRIYPFNKGLRIYGGVYHPPFYTLKIGTFTDDIKLKLYR